MESGNICSSTRLSHRAESKIYNEECETEQLGYFGATETKVNPRKKTYKKNTTAENKNCTMSPGYSFDKNNRGDNGNLDGNATYQRSTYSVFRTREDKGPSLSRKNPDSWTDPYEENLVLNTIPTEEGKTDLALTKNVHDKLLEYKLENCKRVEQECNELTNAFGLNSNIIVASGINDYPCVNVSFMECFPELAGIKKQSKNEQTTKESIDISTLHNLFIPYFIAIANYYSSKEGLGLELQSRSSFGHMSPSIAECGCCLRIELGITPPEYAIVIAETIREMGNFIEKLRITKISNSEKITLLPKTSALYNALNQSRIGGKPLNQVLPESSLLKLLVQDVYNKMIVPQTKTYVEELFRSSKENNSTVFLSVILFEAYNIKGQIDHEESIKHLIGALENMSINGDRISYGNQEHKNSMATYLNETHCPLNKSLTLKDLDVKYQEVIRFLYLDNTYSIEMPCPDILQKIKLDTMANIESSYKHNEPCVPRLNDYGSDSDFEMDIRTITPPKDVSNNEESKDEIIKNDKKPEFALVSSCKYTTVNGMSAINLAYKAAAMLLGYKETTREQNQKTFPKVLCEHMYYETLELLKESDIIPKIIKPKERIETEILIFDLNYFNSSNIKHQVTLDEQLNGLKKLKYVILDDTSTTHKKVLAAISTCLRHGINTIFCVSSGLKNQQLGNDCIPFGTVRVFNQDNGLIKIENIKQVFANQDEESIKRVKEEFNKSINTIFVTPIENNTKAESTTVTEKSINSYREKIINAQNAMSLFQILKEFEKEFNPKKTKVTQAWKNLKELKYKIIRTYLGEKGNRIRISMKPFGKSSANFEKL